MSDTETEMAPRDLVEYVYSEPASIQELRHRPLGVFPWPSADNPMLKQLVKQATEIAKTDGLDEAIMWTVVHSWFEGACTARALDATDDPEPTSRKRILEVAGDMGVSEATVRRYAEGAQQSRVEKRREIILGTPIPEDDD